MEHRVTGSVITPGVDRYYVAPFTTRTFEEAVTKTWQRMFDGTLVPGPMPQVYNKVIIFIKEVRPGGPEHVLELHPRMLPHLRATIEGGILQDLTFGNSLVSYENYVVEDLDV